LSSNAIQGDFLARRGPQYGPPKEMMVVVVGGGRALDYNLIGMTT
jgi:hypothetical protein